MTLPDWANKRLIAWLLFALVSTILTAIQGKIANMFAKELGGFLPLSYGLFTLLCVSFILLGLHLHTCKRPPRTHVNLGYTLG